MTLETRSNESVVDPTPDRYGIETAMVLVEIGELDEAESEVVRVLAEHPNLYDAHGLLARIKHIKGELTQAFTC